MKNYGKKWESCHKFSLTLEQFRIKWILIYMCVFFQQIVYVCIYKTNKKVDSQRDILKY